jgi:anthranilate synthase component 2
VPVKVEVFRNDKMPLEKAKEFDKIILSPGPGVPSEAGLLIPLIKEYASTKSILGVCLGHQAIGEAFGASLVNLSEVYHGVSLPCHLSPVTTPLFKGLPKTFEVGRYHSWVVNKEGLPNDLEITAEDENGLIMAMQHTKFDIQAVQFHPESILTPLGEAIMKNWLEM